LGVAGNAAQGPVTPAMQRIPLGEIAAAYWPVLAVAFVVSLAMAPVCRAVAIRRNIVDRPDDWLKPHKKPIPYLGGVAIFLGWAAGLIAGAWWVGRVVPEGVERVGLTDRVLVGVLLGGAAIMGLGLFDDLRLASPRTKLIGTALVALLLVLFGIGDTFIGDILRTMGVRLSTRDRWVEYAYTVPITFFIVIGACNATNLLDGLDGLCSGVLSIIALGFLVLAAHMATYGNWGPDDARRMIITLAMMGGALGFLPYNRNPATIFMGDAGSMLLGFTAAVMILMFAEAQKAKWMLGAVVVMGLPIADMCLTLARRWRAQRPLMLGDRSHFYDQLRDRGHSVRQVVIVSYGLAAVYAAAGCLVTIFFRTLYAVALFALLGVLTLWAIARFRMVRVDSPKPAPGSETASVS
jgi:UDP-GlcNAc:undecaprenyl-phosphate GlcNAc-1-phosphate transferase